MSTTFNPATADRVFVVGTACTELEQLYQELLAAGKWTGLNENHMRVVSDYAIRGRVSEKVVLDVYDKCTAPFIDKCHPNLWMADNILRHWPKSIIFTMRPAEKHYNQVLNLMVRSTSCKKWCQTFAGLPYPNKFIGAKTRTEYQSLDIRGRCRSRLMSHIEEIDRLAAKYPGRFIALTPFVPDWKTKLKLVLAGTPLPTQPQQQLPTQLPKQPIPPTPTLAPTPAPPTPAPPTVVRARPSPKKIPSPKKPVPPRKSSTPTRVSNVDPNRRIVLPHMPPTEKSTSLRKNIAFYWINLDRAPERKEQMESQLNARGIQHHRISAFDGRSEPLNPYLPVGWPQAQVAKHKYELATTLSHLKAIHRFVRSGEDVGIICEDDTIFEFEARWPESLQDVLDKAPSGWEVMQLSLTLPDPREWTKLKSKKHRYVRRQPNYFSALTYAIKRKYAISVLRKFSVPVDSDTFSAKLKGNVTRLQSELNLIGIGPHRLTVYPAYFTYPTGNTSFIHPTHLHAHEYSKKLSAQQYN